SQSLRGAPRPSAWAGVTLGRPGEISPPSSSPWACRTSPPARSRGSTQPPLIRIARPEAVAPLACCARPGPPLAPITLEAATAVAAAGRRKWRGGGGGGEMRAPQKEDELPGELRPGAHGSPPTVF